MKPFILADETAGAVALSEGVAILLSIVFLLVSCALLVLLFFGIRRERNRYIAEKLKANSVGKPKFDEMLARKLKVAGKRTHFTVMLFRVLEGKSLLRSLGEKQYHAVLVELQERFYAVLPKGAAVSIYEEDQIAALFDGDLDRKAVSDLAAFCLAEGGKPIVLITKVKVSVELILGAAIYSYSGKQTAEDFFANVTHALMLAEAKGPNKYVVHSPEVDYAGDENVKFYQDVRKAIENGEFSLSYQPILSMDGKLVAYESFLRWNHKEYGIMRANRFLPVLVQSGDIQRIGMDAFTQLCLTVNRYRSQNGGAEDPVVFSMNFSTRQMLLPTFVDDLSRLMKRHHLTVSDFCIEVSDFKTPAVLENLKKLRERGFRVAVDGFNMEGSSNTLNELQALSPEWVKLPVSFVKQCETNFFAKGMAEMLARFAENENIKLIVTGVEDAQEAESARGLGILYGQGRYFGEEVEDLFEVPQPKKVTKTPAAEPAAQDQITEPAEGQAPEPVAAAPTEPQAPEQ